jgi:cupin fold WbuC family metalloprotein
MTSQPLSLFTGTTLDELAAKATASPRGRVHLNLHASADDPVQRFFVIFDRRSYVRPHRHATRAELALVVRGEFDLITFDDRGTVVERQVVGKAGTPTNDLQGAAFAFETQPATWHTLLARTDGSAFLEIKQGPYDPTTAAEFAPWAPAEGDAEAPDFMQWARTAATGSAWR